LFRRENCERRVAALSEIVSSVPKNAPATAKPSTSTISASALWMLASLALAPRIAFDPKCGCAGHVELASRGCAKLPVEVA
jgi:hypothetical protein